MAFKYQGMCAGCSPVQTDLSARQGLSGTSQTEPSHLLSYCSGAQHACMRSTYSPCGPSMHLFALRHPARPTPRPHQTRPSAPPPPQATPPSPASVLPAALLLHLAPAPALPLCLGCPLGCWAGALLAGSSSPAVPMCSRRMRRSQHTSSSCRGRGRAQGRRQWLWKVRVWGGWGSWGRRGKGDRGDRGVQGQGRGAQAVSVEGYGWG